VQQSNELSQRERDVIGLVAEGKSNKEIAAATGLAPGTVKSYLETIRRKTATGNRVEMANWWNAHKDQG
jgi:DNA-binding CsgD family transcriptional regulator